LKVEFDDVVHWRHFVAEAGNAAGTLRNRKMGGVCDTNPPHRTLWGQNGKWGIP